MTYYAWCAGHRFPAQPAPGSDLVLVGVLNSGPGPPWAAFACGSHFAAYGMVPLSSHPTGAHTLPADHDGRPIPVPAPDVPRLHRNLMGRCE
ncbi:MULTISPECIES: hypothetical protein [Streptomycetaceae]|uniref:Uncharacterized protein n=1 Tax=Streptantibioticus cattleyicolor (strain ATCC 35852 / DSM 46488 / JCM 4925 / NBRC 14057 / NRRL 8057) TaxID=1003195 RepID=F8JYR7_STREN|nr:MULTISPECIES: hypothetical protein [Streptomycetaceae]AEW93901.1 hypothetical protein SCATT_15300 [Streptantibioticus cattleyicolor NRRL 8057 = DSM 46488]MYS58581.1 hypothetical protein [Streptomyces sp. SID5468]CCB74248.1 protein of unknown function [Streptantibioticus cattleyicolor NRRL 8057 = DSM 46488]